MFFLFPLDPRDLFSAGDFASRRCALPDRPVDTQSDEVAAANLNNRRASDGGMVAQLSQYLSFGTGKQVLLY